MLTIRESVRYRGRSGHWSWLAHRLSGLAILAFLIVHVWDTANATYAPHLYRWSVDVFKQPLFGLGEVALVGAVLYHAFNGVRLTVLDFKPEWWKHQQRSAIITWALFFVAFIPIAVMMINGIVTNCSHVANCWAFPRLSDYPR
jgi:succinate dehydrogenase / fumarate reductase cytochrome b subunit